MILTLIVSALLITACTNTKQIEEKKNTQLANPASEFCIKNGGKLEIVTASDGSQSGNCKLADGTICEEWQYFRGECPKKDELRVCTMEWAPVCGEDGITYGNKCGAGDTPIKYEGECKDAIALNKPCTREYLPVCGINNITYDNKCLAGDIKLDYEGNCH